MEDEEYMNRKSRKQRREIKEVSILITRHSSHIKRSTNDKERNKGFENTTYHPKTQ